MKSRVIHFGLDDCYRIQVLKYAGYEVRHCQLIESLAHDLQSAEAVALVVISEEDWNTLTRAAQTVRAHTSAPLVLFRRTQQRIDESLFDRVYPCLAPPHSWLPQIAELIVVRGQSS